MQDMVREAFQDDDWMFKNATENGISMNAEELVWYDVHDDTALTSEEMIVMMNGEGVLVDSDGGFVAKSALDEELTDEYSLSIQIQMLISMSLHTWPSLNQRNPQLGSQSASWPCHMSIQ